MDLKDLFGNKPTNYVQFPPEEVPTLEKFLAERSMISPETKKQQETKIPNMFGGSLMPDAVNTRQPAPAKVSAVDPVDDDLKAAVIESDPVDESRLEEIKAMFQQEPQSVVADPSRTPASNLFDIKSIKETIEKDGYKPTGTDLAMTAVPLIADILTGGTGVGAKVGADYLGKKQEEIASKNKTLEQYLMDIQKTRATAKEKARSGLSNEEWAARELFKANLKQKLDAAKVPQKEQEKIMDLEMELSKEWRKDPFTVGTRKVADSFKRIMSVDPTKGDPIEDMGLIFDLMRALDPQSVVRESEQAMAIGARSYEDVAKYFTDLMSGNRKMTPTQVKNIKKFAARLYTKRMEGQKEFDRDFYSKAEKYGLDPNMIVGQLGDKTPLMWTNRKTGQTDVVLWPNNRVEEAIKAGAKRF